MSPLDGGQHRAEPSWMAEVVPETSGAGGRRRSGLSHAAALTLATRRPIVHGWAAGAFIAAALVALAAHQSGFQVTAAIVFLLGVTAVGALEGMKGGLLAAIAASAVYNFVLSEPTFRFSLATLDDYVPLLAFNLGAMVSGFLAGRLNDRAFAAELATHRLESLLNLSHTLQAAVSLADVASAVDAFADAHDFSFELYVLNEGMIEPLQPSAERADVARRLVESGMPVLREGSRGRGYLLSSPEAPLGALVVEWSERPGMAGRWEDLGALANLVSIAAERCLLLGRLAEAELVRKSEEFKTALLSSVSHDLRTPLAAISASASSLAGYGAALPENAKADMLNMIQEQCQRLNRYTANLLSLGRLQAGLDSTRFTECDAMEALGSALAHAKSVANGHEFVRIFATPEALVRADPVMLEQVFYNVLENSARYSEPGSRITVDAGIRQGKLAVRVRDEGEGIPLADLERVFDRFYRGTEKHSRSTGLGLAIARGFTEAFGGRIWAELANDPAGGTIVTIEIPALSGGIRA